MQVSVEATQGLERRMTVTVSAERINQEVDSRLKNLSRTVRLSGFRPGKVPVKVVASRFGAQVRNEVINEVTQSTFQEAVMQENLKLASMPSIEPTSTDKKDGDFEYVAVFEVVGEVELAPLEGVELVKPVSEITDQDVDNMIETLRKQRATWNVVERAAQMGDQVLIDFHGLIDGKDFEGNQGKGVQLVLGSNSFIAGFEDKLVGAKSGETVTAELTFPDSYRIKDVAGKPVTFDIKVHTVSEAVLPEIDEEFMRGFEVEDGSMDTFRNDIRDSMQAELDLALQEKLKQNVLELLYSQNSLELPKAMVDSTIDEMMSHMQSTLSAQGGDLGDLNLDRSLFEESARRKVALGMLVSDITRRNNLIVDHEKVRSMIEKLAASYDAPDEVVRWYYADRSRLANIESLALEELVVDWVLEQVNVKEDSISFEEIMQSRRA